MFKDYVGETEEEAINLAIEDLHIERADFDVEVLENNKKSIFKKGSVKIRVYVGESEPSRRVSEFSKGEDAGFEKYEDEEDEEINTNPFPEDENENRIVEFIAVLTEKMGFKAKVEITSRTEDKINICLITDESALLIGRHGQTLDAMQVIANSYFSGDNDTGFKRIVLDSENYRVRREDNIIRGAFYVARKVRSTRKSALLEPMNSYERRLVHRALDDFPGVRTESEGEGLIKTIRVIPE